MLAIKRQSRKPIRNIVLALVSVGVGFKGHEHKAHVAPFAAFFPSFAARFHSANVIVAVAESSFHRFSFTLSMNCLTRWQRNGFSRRVSSTSHTAQHWHSIRARREASTASHFSVLLGVFLFSIIVVVIYQIAPAMLMQRNNNEVGHKHAHNQDGEQYQKPKKYFQQYAHSCMVLVNFGQRYKILSKPIIYLWL